ncbi:MAG: hypothetical protein ACRC1D_03130 [Culicoidibacterales bacterium]
MLKELKAFRSWGVVVGDCKKPRSPIDGNLLDSSNPSTWFDFETCYNEVRCGRASYVCFCFSENDPFCFIDVDNVGELWDTKKIMNHLEFFGTYTEFSRSGCGIHFIGYGKKPENSWCKKKEYEVYDKGHWLTITFDVIYTIEKEPCEKLGNIETQVAKLIAKLATSFAKPQKGGNINMDNVSILRALRKKPKTNALLNGEDVYGDESTNDFALMGSIGFYANYEKSRMIELFDMTTRGKREKWKMRADYREMTVNKILGG